VTSGWSLDGPRFGPAAGGTPRQLVVLLHGWGADGNDLIGLGQHWSRILPHAEFLSPHAPFEQDDGFGRQWYSLGDLSPQGDLREAAMAPRAEAVRPLLEAYLDGNLQRAGIPPDRLALVGFSQGTMMALYVGLRRAPAPAGILGFSGRLVGLGGVAAAARKPEILLIHGEADEVLPAASSTRAGEALRAAGYAADVILRPRLGHDIDDFGLHEGGAFLKRVLQA
jgi:phospholipase/carboxylesterase